MILREDGDRIFSFPRAVLGLPDSSVRVVGVLGRHYAAEYSSFLRTMNKFTRAQVANNRLAFFASPR